MHSPSSRAPPPFTPPRTPPPPAPSSTMSGSGSLGVATSPSEASARSAGRSSRSRSRSRSASASARTRSRISGALILPDTGAGVALVGQTPDAVVLQFNVPFVHPLADSVAVVCGPDWVSATPGSRGPPLRFHLGGCVDPAASAVWVSRGRHSPRARSNSSASNSNSNSNSNSASARGSSPHEAASQTSERSYAFVSSTHPRGSQARIEVCLSKRVRGLWSIPITGPPPYGPATLPPTDEDGTPLRVTPIVPWGTLSDSEVDSDRVISASSGPVSPMDRSFLLASSEPRRPPAGTMTLGPEDPMQLQQALAEAFADLQAIRDEFDHSHPLPPRAAEANRRRRRASSRALRSRPARAGDGESDSDAGGSQASATILSFHPPAHTLGLVFPDPLALADLGIPELEGAEGDVSSGSLGSPHCVHREAPFSARSGTGNQRHRSDGCPPWGYPTPNSASTSTSTSLSGRRKSYSARRHRRRTGHRSHPPGPPTATDLGVGLGLGMGVIAASAVAFVWWRRILGPE